jgi:HK97 family phage portal protein
LASNKLTWLQKAALRIAGYNVPTINSSLNLWKTVGNIPIYRSWSDKDWVQKGFLVNPHLYAIVNRITSTAAVAPFAVYRVKNEVKAKRYKNWTGKNATKESIQKALEIKSDAYELVEGHPLQNIIDRPNEWQRDDEFTQTGIGFKLLTGERFLFLTRMDLGSNSGKLKSVTNLPPQCMVVKAGENMFQIASYELHIGTQIPIEKEDIIFSRYWNPAYDMTGSHLRGMSPLRSASKLLDRMEAAQDRSTIMLQAAGAAGLLFNKAIEQWTEAQAIELKRKINTEILGTENAGNIGAANGDIGYINFGLSAVDMALLEQEKWSLEMLCNIYKVPPGLFMSSANATDNNIREWNRQLISQAVIPALSDLRDDWNEIARAYGSEQEVYVDYDITVFPEMQEDLNTTATRLDKMWYMTGNEKRIAMGMDEDLAQPMLNTYLVPSSLKEISDIDPANVDREMERVDREFEREQNLLNDANDTEPI